MPKRPSCRPARLRSWPRRRATPGRTMPGWPSAGAATIARRRFRSTRCISARGAATSQEGGRYLSYRELAEQLVPYVVDLGFTHIEVMPVTEYPFDGSWGYQPVSLFAPTARYGAPDDFRAFVDACHGAGLGVWLDWVPGHFPNDAHGLGRFDGTALYEHADPRQGLHRDWNTLIYNFGRREVANFLLVERALLAARVSHRRAPGRCRRLDALSRLQPQGGRVDPQRLWRPRKPRRDRLPAADERAGVRRGRRAPPPPPRNRPPGRWCRARLYVGGLGFGFKWNMGWMHDTLGYISRDPIHRKYHHNDLTFGLLYAFHENFILPLSHDEVVHGKGSLLGRMPGDRWQRFANLRAYFAFMWTHPGKKLLFMGGEFAPGARMEPRYRARLASPWRPACTAGCSCWCATSTASIAQRRRCISSNASRKGFPGSTPPTARKASCPICGAAGDPDELAVIVCQFHAGAAPRLPHRRAARRPLSASASTPTLRFTAAAASAMPAASTPNHTRCTASPIRCGCNCRRSPC